MTVANLVGLVHNSQMPDAGALAATIVESLGLRDRSWTSSAADLGEMLSELESTTLIVVVGGDGTILRTVRVVAPFDVPIVGINMGRVGFMSELRVEEALEKLPSYLNDGMRTEKRMMLEASVIADSQESPRLTVHALNDVVVGRSTIARLLNVDVTIDGVRLPTSRADAVIVSTATGSTGYAMSAGGPILYPEAQLMVVRPVAAHTGLRDALVVPPDSVVELRVRDGHHTMLSADGFQDSPLDGRDTVSITRSPHVVRFLRAHAPSSFYSALMWRLGLQPLSEQPSRE